MYVIALKYTYTYTVPKVEVVCPISEKYILYYVATGKGGSNFNTLYTAYIKLSNKCSAVKNTILASEM